MNKKEFASVILIIALVVIIAGGFGYFKLTQKPTQQDTDQFSGTETSRSADTKTYSTVVYTSNNYSSQAYLEGSSKIATNAEWKGTLVIPQDVVGKAGNADINWGDGKVDSGGEIGQTGTIWNFLGTDRVVVSHTYVKPGTYQIQVSLWLITGYAPDGGGQQTMLSIKKTITVKIQSSCPSPISPQSPSDICAGIYIPDAYDKNGCVSGWRCTKPVPVY